MSTVAIAINLTNLDTEDRRGAKWGVEQENSWRTSENQRIIAMNLEASQQEPPGPQLPLLNILPMGTAVEIKNSYEIALPRLVMQIHNQMIFQANEIAAAKAEFRELKTLFADASPAKQAEILALAKT